MADMSSASVEADTSTMSSPAAAPSTLTTSTRSAVEASMDPTASSNSAMEQARLRKERREAKIKAGGSARLGRITSMAGGRKGIEDGVPASASASAASAPSASSSSAVDPTPPSLIANTDLPSLDIRASTSSATATAAAAAAASSPPAMPSAVTATDNFDDPAEMDISRPFPGQRDDDLHFATVRQRELFRNALSSGEQLRQQRWGNQSRTDTADQQDPMTRILQQLMGGNGDGGVGLGSEGGGGDGGVPAGLPVTLAELLAGRSSTSTTTTTNGSDTINEYSYLWRLVHALCALSLGLYIAFFNSRISSSSSSSSSSSPFIGSRTSRIASSSSSSSFFFSVDDSSRFSQQQHHHHQGIHVFWIFTTLQLLLQSTRYFFQRSHIFSSSSSSSASASASAGPGPGLGLGLGGPSGGASGILSILANFLPPPYGNYLRLLLRYGTMLSIVVSDALLVIFVLGCVAWWNGS